MPTPSITARNIAHMMAPFLAAFIPPRMAKEPPVKKPAMTVEIGQSCHKETLHWTGYTTDAEIKGRLTGIVRVFLLSYSLHGTIVCGKQPTPYPKVAS
jgi:hypothetical protein